MNFRKRLGCEVQSRFLARRKEFPRDRDAGKRYHPYEVAGTTSDFKLMFSLRVQKVF